MHINLDNQLFDIVHESYLLYGVFIRSVWQTE